MSQTLKRCNCVVGIEIGKNSDALSRSQLSTASSPSPSNPGHQELEGQTF